MGRPRAVDDRELLDAAMFAFWANGYGGVSTRALEEATLLPASSLYHRFGSKEGLFVAALEHYLRRVVGVRITRYLEQEDAAAGLRAFYTSVYRVAPHPYHACLLANTWTELGTSVKAVSKVLAQGNRQLLAAFAANVARGQVQGAMRLSLVPPMAAQYLLLGLQGLLATARGQRDHATLDVLVDMLLSAVVVTDENRSRA
jgi:TetR/AcrR family transcriptional repressor of nem operon